MVVAVLALMVVAVPATASAEPLVGTLASSTRQCTNSGQIFGANSSTGAVTSSNNCGRIGVNVYYSHIGGASRKGWKYQSSGTVEWLANNTTRSQHYGANHGTFTLYV